MRLHRGANILLQLLVGLLIIKWVQQKSCDLVAMSTHGHRFLADMFLGTTATKVRHSISVPILMLRAK